MVEIHDLHVRFHGASREAVAGIDLTIRDGEVVGLVGESGSGKTVTAMTLSGLIERKQMLYALSLVSVLSLQTQMLYL